MWILNYITKNANKVSKASSGSVTNSSKNKVGINSSLNLKELSIVSPYGISYLPPVGEESVVLPMLDGQICIGCVNNETSLKPGELMLKSEGGAYIHLKNNGSIDINGEIFERKK